MIICYTEHRAVEGGKREDQWRRKGTCFFIAFRLRVFVLHYHLLITGVASVLSQSFPCSFASCRVCCQARRSV